MNGSLTEEQWSVLDPYIEDRVVYDLGAGDLFLAHELDRRGARKIIAVDRHDMPTPTGRRIKTSRSHFHQLEAPDSIEVAFLSWPVNWFSGVEPLLLRAETVAYLGRNTDGIACGSPHLWEHLSSREVLEHVPNRHNVLIVYGRMGVSRSLLPEEMAAIHQERIWSYDELYE